ncbi:MAG: S8 family serine peptidase, partial [bacterium]
MVAYEALGYPDDPAWPRQWHLAQVGAPSGWRSGGGAGITVAVIDTGLRRVPDLDGARVLPGASFVAGEPDVTDLNGHGTHVAGTLAQVTHNGQGAAGMSPSITLLPLKALSGAGQGQSAWIAAAIDEAADQGAR